MPGEGAFVAGLMLKRVDLAAAADQVRAAIIEFAPSAGVQVRTFGDPAQSSVLGAFGREFGRYFASRENVLFSVQADWGTPRPLRLHCNYVAIGRGAGPLSILYLTRLPYVVPGTAAFKRGRFRSGRFDGERDMAAKLSAVDGLGSAGWR